MDEAIKAELMVEEPTEYHKVILDRCKRLVSLSREKMTTYYQDWDHNMNVYDGLRWPDAADKEASNRGEPQKFVVPLSYGQVQTFVAFCISLYYQNDHIYEFEAGGPEDYTTAAIATALVERDLEHNVFEVELYRMLLDVARLGMGVIKTGWIKEIQDVMTDVEVPQQTVLGAPMPPKIVQQKTQATAYLGNLVKSVSPYQFFPDTRVPLAYFQTGEFCASENIISLTHLKELERNGDVAGTQFISQMSSDQLEARRSRIIGLTNDDATVRQTAWKNSGSAILTECQIKLIPKEVLIDGKPMGPEDYPVIYNIWYVNDQRVVKCEPLGYLHNQFTYDIAEFSTDAQKAVSKGLSDSIDMLQDVISWFINSRIASVRKTIQNWIVADTKAIEIADINSRAPVIRLKPNVSGASGIDRYIKQLEVNDVTQHHLEDVKTLQDIVQLTTGINDNALGMFHTGRRSATEARNVNSAAAARLSLMAKLIFKQCLKGVAEKMISNLRQGLDQPTTVRVMGDPTNMAAYQQFVEVDKSKLVGNYDLRVFDSTLPVEKHFEAEALQELFAVCMQNPQVAAILNIRMDVLLLETLKLRGVTHPERFFGVGQTPLYNVQQPAVPGAPGQPPGGSPNPMAGGPAGVAGQAAGTPGQPGFPTLLEGGARPGGQAAY